MIVVADTSPINYLVLIEQVEVLSRLYDRVLIPLEVHNELRRPGTPEPVRQWAENLPRWCEVRSAASTADESLRRLDAGERDAILLAVECGADTRLMDESDGRREALRRRLRVTGTLGVLEKAAQRGWVNFSDALGKLERTNFRLSASIRDEFLKRNQ